MDVRNGHIYSAEEAARMPPEDRAFLRPMESDPTAEQLARGRVGRNDPCPCGSNNRFKACCLVRMAGPRRNPAQEREYALSLAADEIAVGARKPLPVIAKGD